jgi:hypothetical protein
MRGPLILLGASVLATLTASELTLRAFTPLPVTQQSNKRADAALLYRLDPRLRDVNEQGFRNPEPHSSYDIVAIGDSHTYGYNVGWRESWPHQLGSRTGKRVYNMGVGSYGVYQYSHVFGMALQYNPSHIILGLYPANDLDGSCAVLALAHWRKVIQREGLETPRCPVQPASSAAHQPSPARQLFWLASDRLALVNLMHRSYSTLLLRKPAYTIRREQSELAVSESAVALHLGATALDVALNATNFRNSLRLFRRMAARAGRDVNFAVMIIPSKDRVLATWAERGNGAVPAPVRQAVDSERTLARNYRAFFEGLGVATIDATDAMVLQVERDMAAGRKTFPDHDGHPLAHGYGIYAELASQLITRSHARNK